MAEKRVKVLVSGMVQGVFYRVECGARARQLGLGGSVRNLPDGSVEAVFEGDEERVDRMVDWCREGPRHARVEKVEVHDEPLVGEQEFRITH